jgi:hypothetical protein
LEREDLIRVAVTRFGQLQDGALEVLGMPNG